MLTKGTPQKVQARIVRLFEFVSRNDVGTLPGRNARPDYVGYRYTFLSSQRPARRAVNTDIL